MDAADFEYSVVRSGRRTVAIHIDPEKGVVVRAPRRARDSQIRDFLKEKSPWIINKLAEAERRRTEAPGHRFLDGEKFLFLGREHVLRVSEAGKSAVRVSGGEILLQAKPGKTEPVLRKWYMKEARETMARRVEEYAGRIGKKPEKIQVRDQKKRWGSCSAKGNISLNWKLIMAPPEILDYVVAHEVCHLLHPNHGRKFWLALEEVMPDYGARRTWIKQNGHKLGF